MQMNLFVRRYESLVYALIKHKITISWELKQRIKYKFLKKALIVFFESRLKDQDKVFRFSDFKKINRTIYKLKTKSDGNNRNIKEGGQKNVRIRVGR